MSGNELNEAWQLYRLDEEPTRPPNEAAPTREETFKSGYERGFDASSNEVSRLHAVLGNIAEMLDVGKLQSDTEMESAINVARQTALAALNL